MKLFKNPVFWAAVIGVFLIAIAAIVTGTYYGTRLPLEMLNQQ